MSTRRAEHTGSPYAKFAANYPYWCSHCRAFLGSADVVPRATDGDWGEFIGQFHPLCGTLVTKQHLSNPQMLFKTILLEEPTFARQDLYYKSRIELAFLNAYSEFRSGYMPADIADEFVRLLKEPADLVQFLVKRGFEMKW